VAIEFQIYYIGLTAAGTAPESSDINLIAPDSLLDCLSNQRTITKYDCKGNKMIYHFLFVENKFKFFIAFFFIGIEEHNTIICIHHRFQKKIF
jgi:hypothetical protein